MGLPEVLGLISGLDRWTRADAGDSWIPGSKCLEGVSLLSTPFFFGFILSVLLTPYRVLLGSFSNYIVTKSSVPVMVARKKLKKHIKKTRVRLSNNLTTPKSLAMAKID